MFKIAVYCVYAVILLQLCLSFASESSTQKTNSTAIQAKNNTTSAIQTKNNTTSAIQAKNNTTSAIQAKNNTTTAINERIGCACGVFLSGQFVKGSKEQPKGTAALIHEQQDTFPCTPVGNRLCVNKCLDTMVKFLPSSPAILCASIDRDCYKERAYLFIKNCKNDWINTNLSAGREYCCKNGTFYKCPSN